MWRIIRTDYLTIWSNRAVVERLSWYYKVMKDVMPAKSNICKMIPTEADIKNEDMKNLWREHEKLSRKFEETRKKIESRELTLSEMKKPKQSFLDLKIELVKRMLESCEFCERRCRVNRVKGEKGFCRLNSETRISTWFHHWGEEAPLIPSGTCFYVSCNFKCVGCQNYDISQEWMKHGVPEGSEITPQQLASIQRKLRKEGVLNINHVGGDPTPHAHTIIESFKYLDVNVPQLWNSNMYCSLELMKILSDLIDIWLPDFKYGNNECAERISRVKNYFEVVSRNHLIAHENGDMIIRHLVLPNHIECCTRPVLEYISKNLPRSLVNVMSQWRPEYLVARHPEKYSDIARRLKKEEIMEAYRIAEELGLIFKPVS